MAKDKKTETKKGTTKNNETKKVDNKQVKNASKTKKIQKKEGLFKGIKKEIKLIKWPEKKDVIKYSITTLIFCVIVALFFVLLTYLLSIVKGI